MFKQTTSVEKTNNGHRHLEDKYLRSPVLTSSSLQKTLSQQILRYLQAMKDCGAGAGEQLYKQGRAPALPRWFT